MLTLVLLMAFPADAVLDPHELLHSVFDASSTLEFHLSGLAVLRIAASVLLAGGAVLRPIILHGTAAIDHEVYRGAVTPSVLAPVARLKVAETPSTFPV